MKIIIKTNLVEFEVEDNPTIGKDNYTKRTLDSFEKCVESAIINVIKLHNEIN